MGSKEEILVIASPYDGERLRRALEQLGRSAQVTDGGPSTEAALANGGNAVVLCLRTAYKPTQKWLDRLAASGRPLIVVADAGQTLPERVARVERPINPARLARALEEAAARDPERALDPTAPLPRMTGEGTSPRTSRARVLALLGLAREADYFTLLAVPRHADAAQVRRAYEELRAAIEPQALGDLLPDVASEVEEIREALEEARLVLDHDARRAAYLRAIEQT